jgi:hypothetical protein
MKQAGRDCDFFELLILKIQAFTEADVCEK